MLKKNEAQRAFTLLSFDLIKKIMEHPAGKLSWKTKAFNLWFSANEENLESEEKLEIFKVFTKIVTEKLEDDDDDSDSSD